MAPVYAAPDPVEQGSQAGASSFPDQGFSDATGDAPGTPATTPLGTTRDLPPPPSTTGASAGASTDAADASTLSPRQVRRLRDRRATRYRRRQQSASWQIGAAREAAGLAADGSDGGWVEPPRAAKCSWSRGADVLLHGAAGAHGSAHYSGTIRCGGVWSCPVCASVIRPGRAQEVERAVCRHQAAGGAVLLLTMTLRHQRGDDLAGLLRVLADAWRGVSGRRVWRKKVEGLGYVGTIRALEVTLGQHGWHPHCHLLLLVERTPDAAELADLTAWLKKAWGAEVVGLGGRLPSDARGMDLRQTDEHGDVVARYLSKVQEKDERRWSVAAEVARGDVKEGRGASRTPFELLDAAEPGDRHRWLEYLEGIKGSKALVWSRGLKKRLGVDDVSDEDILNDTEAAARVAVIDAAAWREVRDRPEVLSTALDLVEDGQAASAAALLGGYLLEDGPDEDEDEEDDGSAVALRSFLPAGGLPAGQGHGVSGGAGPRFVEVEGLGWVDTVTGVIEAAA